MKEEIPEIPDDPIDTKAVRLLRHHKRVILNAMLERWQLLRLRAIDRSNEYHVTEEGEDDLVQPLVYEAFVRMIDDEIREIEHALVELEP